MTTQTPPPSSTCGKLGTAITAQAGPTSNTRLLLATAEQTKDPNARLRILEQAEALFLSEMPIIPVYWYTTNYLLHTSVKGWHPLLLNNHPYKFVDLELSEAN